MSKLDKLFQGKLADHAVEPSSGTWENLEARLSKKNKSIVWMRWAAILIFGSLMLSLLWVGNRKPALSIAKETPAAAPVTESVSKQNPRVTETNKIPKLAGTQKRREKHRIPVSTAPSVLTHARVVTREIVETPVQIAEVENVVKPETVKTSDNRRAMVLTYTLDPIAVPDVENSGEKVAAVAEKKDKSFKRMMKIANEVKNSESPLGGIRTMKEDLFALDLKSKTTNKKH